MIAKKYRTNWCDMQIKLHHNTVKLRNVQGLSKRTLSFFIRCKEGSTFKARARLKGIGREKGGVEENSP